MVQKISILERSIPKVDINVPICPFCGQQQEILYGDPSKTFHIAYRYCGCYEMNRFLEGLSLINNWKARIYEIDSHFERDKVIAWNRVRSSGMGSRFIDASFDSFDRDRMPKAYEIAMEYAQSIDQCDGRGLIFTGNAGTGKTHLAAAIAGKVINEYSLFVEFVSCAEWLADIRAAFSEHTGKDIMLEKRTKDAALLIIDDLGRERRSRFTDELLFKVVDFRYKNKMPLIITSNYDLQTLSERIDYAVLSRIIGMCKAVDMNGTDYRVKDFLC